MHVEFGPKDLPAIIDVLHDFDGIGRCGGHEVMVVGQPGRRAVVENETVFPQHDTISRLSHRERREHVDIEAIEENAGAVAVDLSEC